MGKWVTLIDLAGLDSALSDRSDIDAASQEAARDVIERADVHVVCDPSGRFDIPIGAEEDQTVIRVRTKADLPRADGAGADADDVAVCALDGWGLGALRRAIGDAALRARGGAALTVLPRHRRALEMARDALSDARAAVECDAGTGSLSDPEIVAGALRAGLDAVGTIAGDVPPDDVIGRIFATFCVGK